MEKTLRQLTDHPGVRGAYVVAYEGELLAQEGEAARAEAVAAAAPYLSRLFGGAHRCGLKAAAAYVTFTDGRLVIADLGGACLTLTCEAEVELSRLRMTLNVAASDLRADAELAAALPALGAAPPPADAAGVTGPAAGLLDRLAAA